MESPLCPPPDAGFRLIETFRWEPGRGIKRRDRHVARLARSAARLGITPHGVDTALKTLAGDVPLRVRLTIDAKGQADLICAPYEALPEGTLWRVALSDVTLASADPWLQVKTTQRQVYDAARAALPVGADEVLFLNERGEVCEGTITNVFVDLGQGLITPPLSSGVLPGILREELIETGKVRAAPVTVDDLSRASAAFVGNSLRGLIPIRLI